MISSQKYRINSLAKDLGLKSKQLAGILPGGDAGITHQLSPDEFGYVIDTLTASAPTATTPAASSISICPHARPQPKSPQRATTRHPIRAALGSTSRARSKRSSRITTSHSRRRATPSAQRKESAQRQQPRRLRKSAFSTDRASACSSSAKPPAPMLSRQRQIQR